MLLMRAKMVVERVNVYKNDDGSISVEGIRFRAVPKKEGYPKDGSDENNSYAKWTPDANLEMSITNPALFGEIRVGEEYYLDFTRAY